MLLQFLGGYKMWMWAVLPTEVHAVSIFRVKVCRVGEFLCIDGSLRKTVTGKIVGYWPVFAIRDNVPGCLCNERTVSTWLLSKHKPMYTQKLTYPVHFDTEVEGGINLRNVSIIVHIHTV
jgi:hypothetical protein